ncbi:MAG: hypothetical protein WD066_20625 [Planctomycetaceae bacterium]
MIAPMKRVHVEANRPAECRGRESHRVTVPGFPPVRPREKPEPGRVKAASVEPDSLGARVGILHTAGNLICWFGSYGNQDSAGPGSKISTPEIPFWWPHLVCVDEGGAFVADRLNRRLVHVSWTFTAEAETNSIPAAE